MKEYKLKIYIEEHNTETDEYNNVSEPINIGTFESMDEAFERADELYIEGRN